MDTTSDVLLFFDGHPGALSLYLAFDRQVRKRVDVRRMKVQKTQISYCSSRLFACVSLLPVRRKADRPQDYITVTFSLGRRVDSPRVDTVCEPYPGRWTHHVMIGAADEIDGELLDWIREAAAFSMKK